MYFHPRSLSILVVQPHTLSHLRPPTLLPSVVPPCIIVPLHHFTLVALCPCAVSSLSLHAFSPLFSFTLAPFPHCTHKLSSTYLHALALSHLCTLSSFFSPNLVPFHHCILSSLDQDVISYLTEQGFFTQFILFITNQT